VVLLRAGPLSALVFSYVLDVRDCIED
jgi:hypothetical protein